MLNGGSYMWLIGGSVAMLAIVVTASIVMSASLSTTMFLAALAVAAGVVIANLKGSGASPTVAEILHAADEQDG
jgi:hypothetical protein